MKIIGVENRVKPANITRLFERRGIYIDNPYKLVKQIVMKVALTDFGILQRMNFNCAVWGKNTVLKYNRFGLDPWVIVSLQHGVKVASGCKTLNFLTLLSRRLLWVEAAVVVVVWAAAAVWAAAVWAAAVAAGCNIRVRSLS